MTYVLAIGFVMVMLMMSMMLSSNDCRARPSRYDRPVYYSRRQDMQSLYGGEADALGGGGASLEGGALGIKRYYYDVYYDSRPFNQFQVDSASKTVAFVNSNTNPADETSWIPFSNLLVVQALCQRTDIIKTLGLQWRIGSTDLSGSSHGFWFDMAGRSYRWLSIQMDSSSPSGWTITLGGEASGNPNVTFDCSNPDIMALISTREDVMRVIKVRLTTADIVAAEKQQNVAAAINAAIPSISAPKASWWDRTVSLPQPSSISSKLFSWF